MDSEAGFVEAIRKNPPDVSLRLAFADWLLKRGDKRGELIRLECRLAAAPEDAALRRRERRLRKSVPPVWAGDWPLPDHFRLVSRGDRFAQVQRWEEGAGCHGVGGYRQVRTTTKIFDLAGRVLRQIDHEYWHSSSENHGDEHSGDYVENIRFDGESVVLIFPAGGEIVLPPTE